MRRLCILLLAYALALHAGLAVARPVAPAGAVLCHAPSPGSPPGHSAPAPDACCGPACHGAVLPGPAAANLSPRRTASPADWRPAPAIDIAARRAPPVRARGPPEAT